MQGNDCAPVLTPSPLQLRLEGVADISQAQYAGGDETDETAFYALATTPPTADPVSLEEECAIPETQTALPSKGVKALRVLRPPAFLVARAWDYTLTTANPISPWPPPPPHGQEHLLEPVNNWLAHWSQLAKNFPRSTKRNQHCQKPTVANRNPYAALALLNGKSSSKPSSSNPHCMGNRCTVDPDRNYWKCQSPKLPYVPQVGTSQHASRRVGDPLKGAPRAPEVGTSQYTSSRVGDPLKGAPRAPQVGTSQHASSRVGDSSTGTPRTPCLNRNTATATGQHAPCSKCALGHHGPNLPSTIESQPRRPPSLRTRRPQTRELPATAELPLGEVGAQHHHPAAGTTGASLASSTSNPGPPPVVPAIRRSTTEGLLPSQRPRPAVPIPQVPNPGQITEFSIA